METTLCALASVIHHLCLRCRLSIGVYGHFAVSAMLCLRGCLPVAVRSGICHTSPLSAQRLPVAVRSGICHTSPLSALPLVNRCVRTFRRKRYALSSRLLVSRCGSGICHTSPLSALSLANRRVRTLYHEDSSKNRIGSHDSMIPSLRQCR